MNEGGGAIALAIRRPVSVMVGVILVILFGLLSVVGLPIQLTPDVTVPSISVSTRWPGATPAEIETDILEPQEEALKSLPGLVQMTSEARQGSASVTLELEVGTSLQEALVRVNNLLSQVSRYPEAVDQPVISTADAGGPPLAVLVIRAAREGGPVAEYRTWVNEVIQPRLERIRGVAGIRLIGGREQEVHVDIDAIALASRGLTLQQVAGAVRGELRDVSGGDIPLGKRRYVIRTMLAPPTPIELERLVVATAADGTPTTLGQIGKVGYGLRKRESFGMVNGAPTMALLLFREPGYNVLAVTQEIRATTAELQEQLLDREGLKIQVVSDQIGYIQGALDLVGQNLLIGGGLAALVLFFFLRSFGASAIVALSIPISVIGTALGMALLGRTVNVVSLAGMAFAVGMVVDNSIVVLENIDTWRSRTPDVREAALQGTKEVWGAIVASTLTTAAVFIPIITWQDEVGELLRDVAVAISTAVGVSLVVSVFVIPSFSAFLLRSRKPRKGESAAIDAPLEETGGLRGVVARSVRWLVRSPVRSFVVAAIGLGGAGYLGVTMIPPLEYLPTGNRNVVFGVVIPPPGYSVDEMEHIGRRIMGDLLPHVGVEVGDAPALARAFFVGTPDSAFMGAVAEVPERAGEVAGLLMSAQRKIPGIFGFAQQASLFGRRLGGGRSVELNVLGADLTQTIQTGMQLMGTLKGAIPGAQIRPIPGLDFGAPEVAVLPRRDRARQLGVDSAALGLLIDAYVDGAIIGELGQPGEPKRNVLLRAGGALVTDPGSLTQVPIATPSGAVVPLGELVDVDERLGPTVIQHVERQRALTLQISPPDDVPLEVALAKVREIVAPLGEAAGPGAMRFEIGGSAGKLEDAKERFFWILILAVVICFLLLAALFEDFLAPLAILVSVPLAGAGGVLGLRLVDEVLAPQSLDMITTIGFVILVGVVVNNAILVVDGALARLRRGLSLPDALGGAVRGRVRPIFMSALTSLAGLLPLVLFPGSGSELYRGVGAVVLGGLALSTVLTLFLVPAVMALLWQLRGLFRRSAVPSGPDAAPQEA